MTGLRFGLALAASVLALGVALGVGGLGVVGRRRRRGGHRHERGGHGRMALVQGGAAGLFGPGARSADDDGIGLGIVGGCGRRLGHGIGAGAAGGGGDRGDQGEGENVAMHGGAPWWTGA